MDGLFHGKNGMIWGYCTPIFGSTPISWNYPPHPGCNKSHHQVEPQFLGILHPLKQTAGTQKNWWFVDVSPFPRGYFQVPAVCFQGCIKFRPPGFFYLRFAPEATALQSAFAASGPAVFFAVDQVDPGRGPRGTDGFPRGWFGGTTPLEPDNKPPDGKGETSTQSTNFWLPCLF